MTTTAPESTKIYRNCPDCGKALRPQGTKASDYPGTIVNQGRGLCSKDYKRRAGSGKLDEVPLIQGPRTPSPTDADPITRERIEKLRRDQVLFHIGWRRRKGMDVTAPIDLRMIAGGR